MKQTVTFQSAFNLRIYRSENEYKKSLWLYWNKNEYRFKYVEMKSAIAMAKLICE